MRRDQIGITIAIVLAVIILPILYIVLFSAQAINFFNAKVEESNTQPLNAYMTQQECVEAELRGCTAVVSTEGEELWIVSE